MTPEQISLVAALVLATSCATGAPREAEALVPEHAGCREQLADGTCILEGARTLVVITPSKQAVQWSSDVSAVVVRERAELGDDVRETLVLGANAKVLEGRASKEDGLHYRLPLSSEPLLPLFDQALTLRAQGEFERAQKLVESATKLSPEDQARRTFLLGRIALSRGDVPRARPLLWQAAQGALSLGLTSVAVDAANILGYAEAQLAHDPQAAERALLFARKHARGFAEGLAVSIYNESYAAVARGDLRTSLTRLAEAERLAERLAMSELANSARDERANTLVRLGRYAEAREIHAQLIERARGKDACLEARLTGNAGWAMLHALNDAAPSQRAELAADAETLLERAAALADRCENTSRRTNAHVNLALWALTVSDARRAARELELANEASQNDAFTAPWKLEAEGRLATLDGRLDDARLKFARERSLALASGDDEGVWRSLVGHARVDSLSGDASSAAQRYQEAERVLDRLAWAVPLGAGRGLFLDAREASISGLIEALLALGKADEAHRALRHALARSEALVAAGDLRTELSDDVRLEVDRLLAHHHALRNGLVQAAQNDWSLSDEALSAVARERARDVEESNEALDRALALAHQHLLTTPAPLGEPAPGTLHLSITALGTGELVAFAATHERTRALRVKHGPADDLGALLLQPFAREIQAARRIEVRTSGSLRRLDVHTLELNHRPLLSYAPVAYAVESAGKRPAEARSGALVVADPTHALPQAREEGAEVARLLAASHSVTLLSGAQATRAAVLSALAHAELLHFAGHGRLGNTGSLDQKLELADGGSLAMGDVLALHGGPRNVILSACDAGSAPEASEVPRALGIAQAFVARGADAVIAPVRPVDDGKSRELIARIYADYQRSHDLLLALRDAQLGLSQQSDDTWKSFRVWVR